MDAHQTIVTAALAATGSAEMPKKARVVGPEHEVVDAELRAPSEEVCQRGAPFIGLESVLLVDPDPRQLLDVPAPARRSAA